MAYKRCRVPEWAYEPEGGQSADHGTLLDGRTSIELIPDRLLSCLTAGTKAGFNSHTHLEKKEIKLNFVD